MVVVMRVLMSGDCNLQKKSRSITMYNSKSFSCSIGTLNTLKFSRNNTMLLFWYLHYRNHI